MELKLVAVDRLVPQYEQGKKALIAATDVAAILQLVPDGGELAAITKQMLIPVATAAVPTSLIDDDLSTLRTSLGSRDRVIGLYRELEEAAAVFLSPGGQSCPGEAPVAPARRVRDLSAALIDALLEPAVVLRAKIIDALARAGDRHARETSGQQARHRRDERVRALASELGTDSVAKVLAAARNDPLLKSLAAEGARLTSDTVRRALKPLKRRGKKRAQKSQVKKNPKNSD